MPTTHPNPIVGPGNSTAVPTLPKTLNFVQSSFKIPRQESQANVSGLAFGSTYQEQIQANGYLAYIRVRITASGGVGTTAAVAEADAPWSAIQTLSFYLPGGTKPIYVLTGYQAYLACLLGGYRRGDPASWPDYSAVAATGDFTFSLMIPLEIISRNALGALANMNSGSLFEVQINLAPAASVYSTDPTTLPTIAVSLHTVNYTQPQPQSDGNPPVAQETAPPLPGTTQFWSSQASAGLSGLNAYVSQRVGNAYRNLIFVTRQAGVRVAGMPSPFRLALNGTEIWTPTNEEWLNWAYEVYGFDMPLGVYPFPRTLDFDGSPGEELRGQWIPTSTGDKLESSGVWPTTATTLEIITNDVAPTGDYLTGFIG
jgi:hypothetical protein